MANSKPTNEAPIDRVRTEPTATVAPAAPNDTRLRVKFKACKSTEFVTDPCPKEQAQKLARKLYPKVITEYSFESVPVEPAEPATESDTRDPEPDAPGSCSRTTCTERQQGYKHRHDGRLYCKRCAGEINDVNGETLVDDPYCPNVFGGSRCTFPRGHEGPHDNPNARADADAGPVEFEDECPACGGDGWVGEGETCKHPSCTAAEKLRTIPCAGCNVRPPHEHKCHGEPCPCSECREADRIFGGKSDL